MVTPWVDDKIRSDWKAGENCTGPKKSAVRFCMIMLLKKLIHVPKYVQSKGLMHLLSKIFHEKPGEISSATERARLGLSNANQCGNLLGIAMRQERSRNIATSNIR